MSTTRERLPYCTICGELMVDESWGPENDICGACRVSGELPTAAASLQLPPYPDQWYNVPTPANPPTTAQFRCWLCGGDHMTQEALEIHTTRYHPNGFVAGSDTSGEPTSGTLSGHQSTRYAATGIPGIGSGYPAAGLTIASSPTVDSSTSSTQADTQSPARGQLTPQKRQATHEMRIRGACPDCRRRRKKCHPSHPRPKDSPNKRGKPGPKGGDGSGKGSGSGSGVAV